MYSIIYGILIGFAIFAGISLFFKRAVSNFFGIGAVGAVIGFVIGLFAGLAMSEALPTKDVVYGPGKLVSMRSSDGISGTFIWGSGGIQSRTSYNFMQKMDDGSMAPGSVYADETVRIIEDAALKNEGLWTTTMREIDKDSPLYKYALFGRSKTVIRQEFRVPVGTVVQQFGIK